MFNLSGPLLNLIYVMFSSVQCSGPLFALIKLTFGFYTVDLCHMDPSSQLVYPDKH